MAYLNQGGAREFHPSQGEAREFHLSQGEAREPPRKGGESDCVVRDSSTRRPRQKRGRRAQNDAVNVTERRGSERPAWHYQSCFLRVLSLTSS